MKNNISIYIHWPFCKSLCPYCDFNSHIMNEIDETQWREAYLKEIEYFKREIIGKKVKSIFFGGGTPSLMPVKIISSILESINSISDISDAEITLEANPTSSDSKKFKAFKDVGINRLSLGIQSFLDNDLKFLGREHNSLEAKDVINLAAGIFDNFSFDLIYGRPNQTLKSWENELKEAINFGSPHISLYQLTIEKGTPFYKMHKNGEFILPSLDLSADLFELTSDILKSNNFGRYEISNYSKKGFASIHNLCYWHYDDYVGIGAGAHSRISNGNNKQSIMMLHRPDKWLESTFQNGNGIQKIEDLTLDQQIYEMVMMNLRIDSGIFEDKLFSKTGKKFDQIFSIDEILKLEKIHLLKYSKDIQNITLTENGMNLHSKITSQIILL